MSCPLCTREFRIPVNGLAALWVKSYARGHASSSGSIDDEEIRHMQTSIEYFRGIAAEVEQKNSRMVESFTAAEQEVKKRSEEIRQLVDRQQNNLLHELQSLKSDAEAEVRSQLDRVQLALAVLESSLELVSRGPPGVRITQAVGDVRDRAKKLLQTRVIPNEYHAPSYKFIPVDIDALLGDGQNLIGQVVEVDDSGKNIFLIYIESEMFQQMAGLC